jgi:hypothetical protein
MPKDYIPQGDSDLLEFADNFISKISGNEATYGLVAGDTAALTAMRDDFQTNYDDNISKQIDAKTSKQKKDDSRDPFEGKLREVSQRIQTYPGTTDAMRQELQITVKDTTLSSIGEPMTHPVAEIEIDAPLRHTITFYDEGGGGSKGKPDGVKGAEIWCKIGGDATMNEDDYRYLGTDNASPYLAVHKPENAGQKAHYLLRWVNPKNEPGAWSNPVSATITG